MGFDLGNLLQQYLGGAADPARAEQDFPQAAQLAPQGALAQGVTEALRSDQTPPFAQMVSQLFGRSDGQQRAGMLNQLLSNVSPAMLSALAGNVGNLFGQNGQPQVTPEQAEQITPQQVQEIATTAEQHNPGIVDRIGDFYAQHPQLVQALGGAALAIVLGKIAQAHR
ncbi:hypothetical protein IP92_00065 [Pseudoduganella flava]|uniref:DUF937 domain-containing protein n=1 Tax=Pseudoduganella flava TaxID=871742 RepID=A0A562Q319_9BURK|nr:hypothetical protein [Pseudoduganella flava]QGZ41153.1 hypothetical protein GO485_20240 [Pseudoduganella flava]TWI51083.1 hypothetical protein IP92_00065 [Pseudoduganella flava]